MNIVKTTNSITIEFTDEELLVLANDLFDPLAWVETAAREKVANCKNRFLRDWITKFQQTKTVATIPTDDTELINLILTQPDYKSRVDRDKESLPGG